jgi:carbon monoxide dehydrogenase subunit G
MKLEQSFEVDAPLERVWEALIDVERVAPCLPGASVSGRNEDGSYAGMFTIKIGPTSASYGGKLEMVTVDEQAHRATMHAHGTDKRGQGGADATIVSYLVPIGEAKTKVEVDTDYKITGRLARFGRGGMIEDISQRLLREFAKRLQASLTGSQQPAEAPTASVTEAKPAAAPKPPAGSAPAAEPPPIPAAPAPEQVQQAAPPPPPPEPGGELDAGTMLLSILRERISRNPQPVAFVLGLLLAIVVLRRRRS